MTPEYGAAMQLEKIDMLDYADFVAINKFDRPKALDALRDVRKQYRRAHTLFDGPPDEELPVFATIASQFHDHGVNALYQGLVRGLAEAFGKQWSLEGTAAEPAGEPQRHPVIPGDRAGYLRDIAHAVRDYKEWAADQIKVAAKLYQLTGARAILSARDGDGSPEDLWKLFEEILDEVELETYLLKEQHAGGIALGLGGATERGQRVSLRRRPGGDRRRWPDAAVVARQRVRMARAPSAARLRRTSARAGRSASNTASAVMPVRCAARWVAAVPSG